jgi:hypothetical protein
MDDLMFLRDYVLDLERLTTRKLVQPHDALAQSVGQSRLIQAKATLNDLMTAGRKGG